MNKEHPIVKFLIENSFFISVIILIISLPFSVALVSIAPFVVLVQSLIIGNWKDKLRILQNDKSLWALVGVFFIYLFGCIFCRDLQAGFYELKKTFFWLFIPLGFALSPRLTNKKFWILLTVFVCAVTIAAIITSIKIIFPQNFNITDVRDASFVAHISFSLQIIFSVFILWYSALKKVPVLGKINREIILLWSVFLIVFLSLQKSLTGFLALYGALIVFLFYLIRSIKNQQRELIAFVALAIIVLTPFVYTGWVAHNYFSIKDVKPANNLTSESGNQYSFDFQNKQKENGHYVYWYICNDELEKSWNEISTVKFYEKDASGYYIYTTLIRYMTSKGLRKDAAGVYALTKEDIKNVQSGVTNYIFVDKKYSIYPRIYETLWELDTYFNTGNPNDQSLSQRIEFSKAAFFIIKNHLWGIGTGNFAIEFDNAYKQIHSQLNEEFRFSVHNQYLSYIVKFGILGFLTIILFIVSAIRMKKQFKNILLIILIILVGLSSLGESTLETHIGLAFFLCYLSLFLWHPNEPLSQSSIRK